MKLQEILHTYRAFIKWLIIIGPYMFISGLVMLFTVTDYFHMDERIRLSAMVYGTAYRPYVYRTAASSVVRIFTSITPKATKERIDTFWNRITKFKRLGIGQGYEAGYTVEYFYTLIIMYMSLIGIALIMRSMIFEFYPSINSLAIIAYFAPLLFLCCFPMLESWYNYDFPNLLLFMAGLFLLYKESWLIYYPVFVLACFSKETAILIPFIYFLNQSEESNKKAFWLHLIIQGMIFTAIFIFLRLIFRNNPGGLLEFHLFDYNIPALFNISTYIHFDITSYPLGLNILIIAPLSYLILSGWQDKPIYLRRGLTILIPLIVLAIFWGCMDEMRIYFEAIPIMFLLALPSILNILGPENELRS